MANPLAVLDKLLCLEQVQLLKYIYLLSIGQEENERPASDEEDIALIMLAEKFNRFAANGGDLFRDLIVDRIIGFYHRAQKEFPKTQMAFKLVDYLRSMFDEATEHVLQQLGDDTKKITEDLPELSRQYIVKDIEDIVRKLWPNRNDAENRSALEFYKNTYQWLTSDDIIGRWNGLYENYNPGWASVYHEGWEQEIDTGGTYRPSMDEIFQQLEPSEPQEEDVVDEPADEPVGQEVIETKQPEVVETDQSELTTQLQEESPDTRRPVTESIENKIKILDPDTRKKTLEVGIGDTVYNQTASQIFKQNKDYGINRNQANRYATGTITEIGEDSLTVTVPGVEEEFSEQIWPLNNKLWGSREQGKRVVNADYHEENYDG